ncbi:HDOD domain-containing protein [Colwellia hornerae]|uniref:HDOD domain-containing protein n=1 Tax=Colwellia hornerae TaxID=89402 RepID=A0A5C6Q3W1_9GAMM|nr:HDOD domain-containing protein [Colwellia hornerae]TWX58764.1 HDOD domain-containing protein [Colwellia hornerae]TWX63605.1 HDOD domain-containing protein [Colwellia hornerae]
MLFRDGKSNSFPDIDPNQATSNILTNNHLTLGIEQITGDLPAYINFHADTLIFHFPSFLDPKNVVLEILEDVPVTPQLLAACQSLYEKGYKLALDDFDFDEKWAPFYPIIDIIKIDVLQFSIIEISKLVRKLAGLNVTLLAEKVETSQQFERLKMLGFTLFQGYFFARPEMLKQRKITTAKQNILELISQASQIELNIDKISEIFAIDPGLTYKLLRFINSPTYGSSQEITSLKHALAYIGQVELKKFIALLALSDLSSDKNPEIMRLSLVRAKFCEKIALSRFENENPPKAFLTGILSLIDGILDHELEYVLGVLPIHEGIKSALRSEQCDLGDYLSLVRKIEQGLWAEAEKIANTITLDSEICFQAYKDSLSWADEMLSSGT